MESDVNRASADAPGPIDPNDRSSGRRHPQRGCRPSPSPVLRRSALAGPTRPRPRGGQDLLQSDHHPASPGGSIRRRLLGRRQHRRQRRNLLQRLRPKCCRNSAVVAYRIGRPGPRSVPFLPPGRTATEYAKRSRSSRLGPSRLRAGHRLFIGDDRQDLERRPRQARRSLEVQEVLDILGRLRRRGRLVPRGGAVVGAAAGKS